MKTQSQDLRELDRVLADRWLSGLWKLDRQERTADPKTKVKPHLWKWRDKTDEGSIAKRRARRCQDLDVGRQLDVEGKPLVWTSPGDLEEHGVDAIALLAQFKIPGPELVGLSKTQESRDEKRG